MLKQVSTWGAEWGYTEWWRGVYLNWYTGLLYRQGPTPSKALRGQEHGTPQGGRQGGPDRVKVVVVVGGGGVPRLYRGVNVQGGGGGRDMTGLPSR